MNRGWGEKNSSLYHPLLSLSPYSPASMAEGGKERTFSFTLNIYRHFSSYKIIYSYTDSGFCEAAKCESLTILFT